MSYAIPFNRPCLAGNEYKYIAEAIANGHASGDGPFTRRCHALLEEELGSDRVLLTTSCTHALEMAAILLDCAPGDEVIVPAYTYISTAAAVACGQNAWPYIEAGCLRGAGSQAAEPRDVRLVSADRL